MVVLYYFQKRKSMGFYVGNIAKTINLYTVYNNVYYLPIGCFNDVWRIYPNPKNWTDYTSSNKVEVINNIHLRNYQEPCLKAIKDNCDVIKFKVKNRNVDLEIEKVKQIIQIAKKLFHIRDISLIIREVIKHLLKIGLVFI